MHIVEGMINKETLVARVKGEIDLSTADELRDRLDKALSSKKATSLLLDFSGVSFIDSSGLGVLLGRYKRICGLGGKVGIFGLQPQVKRVMQISGLFQLIDEFADEPQTLNQKEG